MPDFYDVLDEYIGGDDEFTDVRAIVRRCWFYDFVDHPIRVWQGKGKLFTSDGNEWLGTNDANGLDHHKTPTITDGRDGSSARYEMGLNLIDTPGAAATSVYQDIRNEQSRVFGRNVTCYLAIFGINEGLRPQTPIVFFREFTMMNSKFSEKLEFVNGASVKKYQCSVVCKDGNFGRSEIPNGTYSNAVQQERARQLGVETDLGCSFVAALANRTYQIP